MSEQTHQPVALNHPWLVAAWPGMGHVGSIAVGYLVTELGAREVVELPMRDYFEVNAIAVQNGIVSLPRLPRGVILSWADPYHRQDLLLFLAEAQPQRDGFLLCQRIIDEAVKLGAVRVVTFAAMATQLRLDASPHVFAAATQMSLVRALKQMGDVLIVEDGQIGGLNGVLLAAAADGASTDADGAVRPRDEHDEGIHRKREAAGRMPL